MKAERRHELKENSLAHGLEQLPTFAQRHGTRIILGAIFVALLITLLIFNLRSKSAERDDAQQALADAQISLSQLQRMTGWMANPMDEAATRDAAYQRGLQQAADANSKAGDKAPLIRAAALVMKGDLNWTLANLPDLPGAATQPSLQARKPRADLLKEAQDAYSQVVSDFSDQKMQLIAARFGLAAIAEDLAYGNVDKSQWNVAREQYSALVADTSVAEPWHMIAAERLEQLSSLEQHPLLNVPPGSASQASWDVLHDLSSTAPTTLPALPMDELALPPATMPSGPTTMALPALPATPQVPPAPKLSLQLPATRP